MICLISTTTKTTRRWPPRRDRPSRQHQSLLLTPRRPCPALWLHKHHSPPRHLQTCMHSLQTSSSSCRIYLHCHLHQVHICVSDCSVEPHFRCYSGPTLFCPVPLPTQQLPHPVASTTGLPLTTTATTIAGGATTRKIPSAFEVAANYARQRQQRQSGGLPFVYPGIPGAPNNPALFQNQGMSHRGIPQGTPSGTTNLQPTGTQISQVGLGLMGNSSYLTSLPEHARAAIASGIPPPPFLTNLQLPPQKAVPGVPQSFHQAGAAVGYSVTGQGQVPGQPFPAAALPSPFMHTLPPEYRAGQGRN